MGCRGAGWGWCWSSQRNADRQHDTASRPGDADLRRLFFLDGIVLKLKDGKITEVGEYMDTELTKTIFGGTALEHAQK